MGLSVAANRFAASVPSTNSMESANIQNYGFDSTESAASIYTPSSTLISTIPAISYKLLGSSSNTRKSPLDMLLSNPIQFIKASWMSPIYKRNVTEAFGSSMPVSKNKKRATKKLPPETPAVTLIASNWRAGAEHQKECETLSPFQCAVTKEPQAKRYPAPIQNQSAAPKTIDEHANVFTSDMTSPPPKKRTSTVAAVSLSAKKQSNGVIPALDEPIELPLKKATKVLANGSSAISAREISKKRKSDTSDETDSPARKIQTDPDGNSTAKEPEPNGSQPSKQPLPNEPGIRVKGFHNRLNDCYRNSVLQLFCSSPVFRHEIGQHDHEKCKLTICVCCTLKALFENHHVSEKRSARQTANTVVPRIIRMARVLPNNFKTTKQEDATEYLHAILHTAKDQLNKGLTGDALRNNPIDKTFGGSFPSVLTCPKCHHRSYNKVDLPSLMLHPSVTPRDNKASNIIYLTDLLDEYLKPEKVDATCEKCKHSKKKFTKQIEIERLPKFLVLNIMRWTGATLRVGRVGADKLMNRLRFDERIKLMEGEVEVEYVLHAVVAHSGRALARGHYISFVKQPDGTWAECNDTMVDQTTWPRVSKAGGLQANILGYQRVN